MGNQAGYLGKNQNSATDRAGSAACCIFPQRIGLSAARTCCRARKFKATFMFAFIRSRAGASSWRGTSNVGGERRCDDQSPTDQRDRDPRSIRARGLDHVKLRVALKAHIWDRSAPIHEGGSAPQRPRDAPAHLEGREPLPPRRRPGRNPRPGQRASKSTAMTSRLSPAPACSLQ